MLLSGEDTSSQSILACWLLLHLATNATWKSKATAEILCLISKYSTGNSNSSDSLQTRLSTIPISAWEDELPALDLAIRETIRIALSGTAFRRNLVDDLAISGKVIEKGTFMVYSLADVHLDPEIYPNPLTFDPERFLEGRDEDKQHNMSYLGWGAGRFYITFIFPC